MSFLSRIFTHYFLPGYSNDQKAKILHNQSIFVLVLFLVFGQVFINNIPQLGIKVLGFASQISVDEVIRLTNEKRLTTGVGSLSYNAQLAAAAKAKGEDMLSRDYWAHVAPDGTQPWKFFTDAGYRYQFAGENLAKDFSNPQSAVEAWMASPSHKDNLLSSKYDEIGVAVVEGDLNGVDTTIIVQLFGKRYNSSIASVTTNVSAKTDTVRNVAVSVTPTLIPTQIPTPTAGVDNDAIAGSYEMTRGKPNSFEILVTPFGTKKGFSVFATSVLLISFGIDSIYLSKRKFSRVGGRTLAHIAFLGMILAVVVIVQSGDILPPVSDALK